MTTHASTVTATSAELDAARLILARMGLSPADLLATPQIRPPAPTRSYWNRILNQWGHRHLNEPTPSQIKQLVEHVKATVVARRNARGGRGAGEHLIAALRCLYRHAEDDGLIDPADNPASKVAKPRRLPSTRRAVADIRLAEINHTAATTGNDPALDSLLLRLHTETACRRGGALALRLQDLDPTQCLIFLREKGNTVRWQPVSPTLMTHLQRHASERHAPRDGQLFRYTDGRPITTRRYDHLWTRLGKHLPWVATQQISTHWLRHTTLTWVERNFGYAVARAYAGHTDHCGDAGTTATYIRAGLQEVAAALAALTGQPHPLTQPTTGKAPRPLAPKTTPVPGQRAGRHQRDATQPAPTPFCWTMTRSCSSCSPVPNRSALPLRERQ